MMSLPLILACLWVLAGAGVALLPMRLQYAPGLTLLTAAPVLIVWLGLEHGLWVALFATFALLSMFRRPLVYLAKRALGQEHDTPEDAQ